MNGSVRLSEQEKAEMLEDARSAERRAAFRAAREATEAGTLDDYNNGLIPGVVYGKTQPSFNVRLNRREVENRLRDALHHGPVVVCDVVLGEVCTALKDGSEVLEELATLLKAYPQIAKVEIDVPVREPGGTRQTNLDLASGRADEFKETALLPDFLSDIFCGLLGYTGPAASA